MSIENKGQKHILRNRVPVIWYLTFQRKAENAISEDLIFFHIILFAAEKFRESMNHDIFWSKWVYEII